MTTRNSYIYSTTKTTVTTTTTTTETIKTLKGVRWPQQESATPLSLDVTTAYAERELGDTQQIISSKDAVISASTCLRSQMILKKDCYRRGYEWYMDGDTDQIGYQPAVDYSTNKRMRVKQAEIRFMDEINTEFEKLEVMARAFLARSQAFYTEENGFLYFFINITEDEDDAPYAPDNNLSEQRVRCIDLGLLNIPSYVKDIDWQQEENLAIDKKNVFRGTDRRTGKEFAAKEFDLHYGSWNAKREIKLMVMMSHVNIMRLYFYTWNEHLKKAHIFMPLMKEGTLTDLKRLDENDISSIAYELLLALQYMHGRRVAHGDIHSQNVLLRQSNHGNGERLSMILCDFSNAEEMNQEQNGVSELEADDLNDLGRLLLYKCTDQLYEDDDKNEELARTSQFQYFRELILLLLKARINEVKASDVLEMFPEIREWKRYNTGVRQTDTGNSHATGGGDNSKQQLLEKSSLDFGLTDDDGSGGDAMNEYLHWSDPSARLAIGCPFDPECELTELTSEAQGTLIIIDENQA